jgi:hypothetical protein
MAELVNLNQFRKKKVRADDKARADQNAVKFGRTRAEMQRDAAQAKLDAKRHADHRREDEPEA